MKKVLFIFLGVTLLNISVADSTIEQESANGTKTLHINSNPYLLYGGVPVGLYGDPAQIIKATRGPVSEKVN